MQSRVLTGGALKRSTHWCMHGLPLGSMDELSSHDREVLDTIFEPVQPLGTNSNPATISSEACNAADDPLLRPQIKDLIARAIFLAEDGQLEQALQLFDEARDSVPLSASVLNDRAQALRLAGREQEALQDLSSAVQYSGGQGRAGVQALCQRASLYRSMGRHIEAKQDFARAAEGGSQFAKSQLVAMNPYAAMCNAMLQKIALPNHPN